jgi:hypothetical protein
MPLPPPVEPPRFGFALCLPVRISYIVDYRTYTFVFIKLYPPNSRAVVSPFICSLFALADWLCY